MMFQQSCKFGDSALYPNWTRPVNGMMTSEVTSVTISLILTPHLGHQKVMVMVMNDRLTFFLFNVNRPYHSWYIVISNWTLKIHDQGHVWSKGLDLENWRSRLWPRSNPTDTFGAFSSIDIFTFRFLAIGIFDWNIANSIFDLENWRSRSWPRSNTMVALEANSSINMYAFHLVAIGPILAEI